MIFIEDRDFEKRRKGLLDDEGLQETETKGHVVKARSIREMVRAKQRIERGEAQPASVWELKPNGKGGFTRRRINATAFQREQKAAWNQSIVAARRKLGLSQSEFARLLGISLRTLHHWEQGTRKPSGAARVLLRVAARHPEIVLRAAA